MCSNFPVDRKMYIITVLATLLYLLFYCSILFNLKYKYIVYRHLRVEQPWNKYGTKGTKKTGIIDELRLFGTAKNNLEQLKRYNSIVLIVKFPLNILKHVS